jgi:uncharacterized YceG family protein
MPLSKIPSLIPYETTQKKSLGKKTRKMLTSFSLVFALSFIGFFSLPSILGYDLQTTQKIASIKTPTNSFPVTVYPDDKKIIEDAAVEAYLVTPPTGLSAATGMLEQVFTYLAVSISHLSLYKQLAGAAGINNLYVTIYPGYRKEQVAKEFASTLGWTNTQKKEFLDESQKLNPNIPEGMFVPGTYFIGVTNPKDVAQITYARFVQDIQSRYGTSTQEQVPLKDALTIASLLEREAGDWEDMRLISGVIWNRLFIKMNLQIDATLQYAKADTKKSRGWWDVPVPDDKYIKSAYNTYMHAGLPPGPISNSSIAGVLAALNPKKTDCLFYFHDSYGNFHCSKNYADHVTSLKKHYGRGK